MNNKSKRPFRPAGKVSRLTFTDEERADPELEKPLKKAEKAADKLEPTFPKSITMVELFPKKGIAPSVFLLLHQ